MWHTVGRFWTFRLGKADLVRSEQLVRQLAKANAPRTYGKVFTGRTHAVVTTSPGGFLSDHLQDRFCWIGAKSQQARDGVPDGRHGSPFALEVWTSPLSQLWAKPATRSAKVGDDHRAALTHSGIEGFVRGQKVREAPHFIEFRIDHPKSRMRREVVAETFDEMQRFFGGLRGETGLTGGVDFVSDFTQLGTVGLLQHVARDARNYELLRHRFDDMHKIMVGRPGVFRRLTDEVKDKAFERISEAGGARRRMTVALARTTPRAYRHFPLRPDAILLG
jgi:hypothetical protein